MIGSPSVPVFCTPLDRAGTTAASAYTPGAGLLSVADGSVFGSPSPSAPVRLTCTRASDGAAMNLKCTGRSGNTLSVSVADGTTDIGLDVGDKVEIIDTASMFGDIHSSILSAIGSLASAITKLNGLAEADVDGLVDDLAALSAGIAANASAVSARLVSSNNLSDLASASQARGHLGLGTAATTDATAYATASQGAKADSAVQPGDTIAVAHGGTGLTAATANRLLKGNGTSPLSVTGVNLGSGDEIDGYKASLNLQSGTSYTLIASDTGKVIDHANAAAVAVTLPNNLPVGFCCTYVQTGAGQVTFAPASGATIRNKGGFTKTAGQYSAMTLYVRSNAGGASAEYLLAGDGA